uniref:Bm686 n=1 Tax=Brugia malayi TaxID=6279 RepID=A0A1I9G4W0_BRUMA|nr:Bm686 [Brugia malayi]
MSRKQRKNNETRQDMCESKMDNELLAWEYYLSNKIAA